MSDTATEPTAPEAAPAAQPVEPAAPQREEQQPETDKASPWDNPEAARAEIERLRRENASDRVNAKQAAADAAKAELAQTLGKALGLIPEQATPEQLQTSLAEQTQTARAAQLELSIYKAAAAKGADAARLLDSRSFMDQATKATDPGALDALIGTALTTSPHLKAAPAAPAAGGADFTGASSSGGRTFTAAQLNDPAFYAANRADILDAYRNGRITT